MSIITIPGGIKRTDLALGKNYRNRNNKKISMYSICNGRIKNIKINLFLVEAAFLNSI